MTDNKTLCIKCKKFTTSIRQGRANYVCKECNNDKTLSDYYQWELTENKK